uniref:Proline rich and Gla domain 1 n=1 Tax=Latimeria chalumnae TaxID=7897 RepID=H3AR92_LATCH|nr:PREDICTED: transmembrane gamma-carboxyglutamic acid protein 1 [Latimeria chalumnae]XP_014346761.1 PREDICTED: transmembrane gamma-carboxyglutamic acid protein 1 [Latimeria chalumnae]|eukprot:XP_006000808.1 PREDICTED: transmembrane gamma-carboxyglutamic acid protein 1 [Latimeria chalumnae]
MDSVFLSENEANTLLKRLPRSNHFLEEIKQGNIERECWEEACSYEEAREAFENEEKTMEFWNQYNSGLQDNNADEDQLYTVYIVIPIIVGLIFIFIIMVTVWRCHLKKRIFRQTAHSLQRNGTVPPNSSLSLVSVNGSSQIPPHLFQENRYDLGGGLSTGFPIHVNVSSDSLSTGLSNPDAPPSYEEATGQPEGQRIGTTTEHHLDPPPQYEEIINSNLGNNAAPFIFSNIK